MKSKLWIGLLAMGLAGASWAGTDIAFWHGKPDTGVLTVEVPEGWTMQKAQVEGEGSPDLVQSVVEVRNTNRTVLLLHCLAEKYLKEAEGTDKLLMSGRTVLEKGQIRGENADLAFYFTERKLSETMAQFGAYGSGMVGKIGCSFTCSLRDTNDLPVVKRILETLKYHP